ncbi:MAG TPA: ROK family protein [Sphingomicrobium sp.]|jgi:fructokinase|nr:ROK family protein [Sphingomicrobium sp.]
MTYAGVELGGTKCVTILARDASDVLAREIVPTTSPDETLGRIERTLLEWKRNEGFDALGIASFGPIDLDPDSATWGHALATPKPGWPNANIAPRLRDAIGVPVAFDTDVNGAALAEMRWGCAADFDDFAYVTVGTGVGVGLIVNGRPTRGFGHCELGHVRVARAPGDDWRGSCPYHGDCVEGLASGSSLQARFGDRLDEIGPDHPVWDSVAWTLAQLCHVIVCAAAPRAIAIGGGVIERQPRLLGKIQGNLDESLNGFIQLPGDGDYVRAPGLGGDAGPLGAIALAMTAKA